MKLRFAIHYKTKWGENMLVSISFCDSKGTKKNQRWMMNTTDGETWTLDTSAVIARQGHTLTFQYHYEVADDRGNTIRTERLSTPRLFIFDPSHDYSFNDKWKELPLNHHLYTTALQILRQQTDCGIRALRLPLFRRTLMFRVEAPQIEPGQQLAIIGNHPALGGWNISRYVPMSNAGGHVWMVTMNTDGISFPIEYKYVVIDETTHGITQWEEGDNRMVMSLGVGDGGVSVIDDMVLRVTERMIRAAGVAVPVFSLRSSESYGVGDFGDLKRMVDWAADTGMRTIQILPVNDTTATHGWTDSHPYNIISAFALHPHYIDLEEAGQLNDKAIMNDYRKRRQELNQQPYSDYIAVDRVKRSYLKQLYAERRTSLAKDADFKVFKNENSAWLLPYCAFCILRDDYDTTDYRAWQEYAVYDQQKIQALADKRHDETEQICYEQYLLDRQLKSAADYARSKGIVIIGDLPISMARYSVDTWMHPSLYQLSVCVGTPPDNNQNCGQNWGLPAYNWDGHKLDGYDWFRRRFTKMQRYFGAVRIDHVAGYFRTWQIPDTSVFASLGHYEPSLPMTADEIEYLGLAFHKQQYTQPFITEAIIHKLFGMHARYVIDTYLNDAGYGQYALAEEVGNQRRIMTAFEGKNDENSLWIRDGLMRLAANVLFVEDETMSGMYHPRRGAVGTPVYAALSAEEQTAYRNIYDHYFYHRHHDYWLAKGYEHLWALTQCTDMLLCAEDLGEMPESSHDVLDRLKMLTLELQMMPKTDGYEFGHLEANPYRSIATITTHDMEPMRLWWEKYPEKAQRYYVSMLQKEGRAPAELTTTLMEEIIARHEYSPSMLCIIALQDLMAIDITLRGKSPREERINTPGDSFNQWRYRMPVTIEVLRNATPFNNKLKTMITRSRR